MLAQIAQSGAASARGGAVGESLSPAQREERSASACGARSRRAQRRSSSSWPLAKSDTAPSDSPVYPSFGAAVLLREHARRSTQALQMTLARAGPWHSAACEITLAAASPVLGGPRRACRTRKMLYDQRSSCCVRRAGQSSGDPFYLGLRGQLLYVLREIRLARRLYGRNATVSAGGGDGSRTCAEPHSPISTRKVVLSWRADESRVSGRSAVVKQRCGIEPGARPRTIRIRIPA